MIGAFGKPQTPEEIWEKINPVAEAMTLAKIAKFAADAVGVFSLFALVVVFSDIAGDKHLTWSIAAVGPYADLGWRLHMPWLPFLLTGALGVWVFNRHGLRILLTLRFRRSEDPEAAPPTPIAKLAVGVALVAFSLLIVVTATKFQDSGRVVDAREAAIVEQTAQRNKAAVQAELDAVTRDLETLTQPRDDTPNLQTQAARATAQGWAQRIEAQPDAVVRARLAAETPTAARADALRERESALRRELAAAPVDAAVAAAVAVDRGGTDAIVAAFAAVPLWFAVATEFLALIMKLVEVLLMRHAQAQAKIAARQAQSQTEAPAPAAADPEPKAEPAPEPQPDRVPDDAPGPDVAPPPSPEPPSPDPVRGPKPRRALPEPTQDELAAWAQANARPQDNSTLESIEEAA